MRGILMPILTKSGINIYLIRLVFINQVVGSNPRIIDKVKFS